VIVDIFETLKLKPIKTEPDVWISRLMIYEQIAPEPITIRDITLTRGLNIVWAEETEDDIPSAEITGHSAGKTTFCRLIRYVLGEKTYGTRFNMDLIQNALPTGYVAAEINVRRKKWSVLRPLGKGRNSYVKDDTSIEGLLLDRSRPAYLETYATEIGLENLLDGLEAGGIVRTGEIIQWEHLLSWCTRDQEARFQNIYDWRSPRSESDTPAFRFPKSGPLFLMRVALGLFLPNELKGEEDLAKLQQDQEHLEKKLEKLKREPQFRINLYDLELRKRLRNILPEEPDIETLPLYSGNLLPDLDRLTTKATEKMENEIADLEKNRKALQANIDTFGANIQQLENQTGILDSLLNKGEAAGKELDIGLAQRQKTRELVTEFQDQRCLGGILYRDCEQINKLQHILQISQLQDAKAMREDEVNRTKLQHQLREQRLRLQNEFDNLKQTNQGLQGKRDALMDEIREKRENFRDLKNTCDGLKNWIAERDQSGGYKEVDECKEKLEETVVRIKDLEQNLTKLLSEHNESRDLLASIFSGAVRSVLSSGTYDGRVSLDNREVTFSITHGTAMTGEAVETLSVLLTDIASLIYTTVAANAHLPGFLLHDSPREADLGSRIYRNFIRFIASLQNHFGDNDNCPFQYILTTTTAPPVELQNELFVKLKLNAVQSSGLLLGRNIGTVVDQNVRQRLFNTGES
jgi:hypothetical protein